MEKEGKKQGTVQFQHSQICNSVQVIPPQCTSTLYSVQCRPQRNSTQRGKALTSSLKLEAFADLFRLSAQHVRIFKLVQEGGEEIFLQISLRLCYVVLLNSNLIVCTNCLHSTKSPNFPPRGKVGQTSKRKRVLCWSIYIISLCCTLMLHTKRRSVAEQSPANYELVFHF